MIDIFEFIAEVEELHLDVVGAVPVADNLLQGIAQRVPIKVIIEVQGFTL